MTHHTTRATIHSYAQLVHAMQTGVHIMMHRDPTECQPKSLRVATNAAMSDHSALAELLIAKGIITRDEYDAAITQHMAKEVDRYERRIGNGVSLRTTAEGAA